MKLDQKEFKEFLKLQNLVKSGKASPDDVARYHELAAKKAESQVENDISWHTKYPSMFRDATNVAQTYYPGFKTILDNFELEVVAGTQVRMVNTPGQLLFGGDDAFNIQMKALWTDLHRRYRGIGTYQSSDLGILLWCIVSIYAALAQLERIYGVCSYYAARNRNVPTVYQNILGINLSQYQVNLANFRYELNRLILKATSLVLPKGLSIVDDYVTLYSNVFKDRDSSRAQIFVFYHDLSYIWNPTIVSTGSAAVEHSLSMSTPTGAIAALENMIDAIINDDDAQRILSDILAAYTDNELLRLLPVPEDYVVVPVYSEERNLQFHNITSYVNEAEEVTVVGVTPAYTGSTVPDGAFCVFQTSGNVIASGLCYEETGNVTGGYATDINSELRGYCFSQSAVGITICDDELMDIWKETATPEDIMIGTRMKHTLKSVSFEVAAGVFSNIIAVTGHGAYVCREIHIYTSSSATLNPVSDLIATRGFILSEAGQDYIYGTWVDTYVNPSGQIYMGLFKAQAYDNAPFGLTNAWALPAPLGNYLRVFGAYDNLIPISSRDLSKMSDVSTLSEWNLAHFVKE